MKYHVHCFNRDGMTFAWCGPGWYPPDKQAIHKPKAVSMEEGKAVIRTDMRHTDRYTYKLVQILPEGRML